MSDTPRIDAALRAMSADEAEQMCQITVVARELEREVAAANEARENLERERDVLRNCQFHNQNELRRVSAEIGALRAEVERLREDAERYRWLRRPTTLGIGMVNIWSKGQGRYDAWQGDELDAAIDAARKE